MGCWNKTCGLSNLHIYSGMPVYVFVLEENTTNTDRCYTTSYWKPVALPFESFYNDYGGGEQSSSNLDIILSGIKQVMREIDDNGHSFYSEDLNEEKFFEAVHGSNLQTTDCHIIDFVMFRKDIVDHILENRVCEYYVGNGKGTSGWKNNYIQYKFTDLVDDIPKFIDQFAETLDASNSLFLSSFEFLHLQLGRSFETKVAGYLRSVDGYRLSRIIRLETVLRNFLTNGKRAEAETFVSDLLKFSFINEFMESTRKLWIPAGHEGSQSSDISGYRELIAATTMALDAEESEYDE